MSGALCSVLSQIAPAAKSFTEKLPLPGERSYQANCNVLRFNPLAKEPCSALMDNLVAAVKADALIQMVIVRDCRTHPTPEVASLVKRLHGELARKVLAVKAAQWLLAGAVALAAVREMEDVPRLVAKARATNQVAPSRADELGRDMEDVLRGYKKHHALVLDYYGSVRLHLLYQAIDRRFPDMSTVLRNAPKRLDELLANSAAALDISIAAGYSIAGAAAELNSCFDFYNKPHDPNLMCPEAVELMEMLCTSYAYLRQAKDIKQALGAAVGAKAAQLLHVLGELAPVLLAGFEQEPAAPRSELLSRIIQACQQRAGEQPGQVDAAQQECTAVMQQQLLLQALKVEVARVAGRLDTGEESTGEESLMRLAEEHGCTARLVREGGAFAGAMLPLHQQGLEAHQRGLEAHEQVLGTQQRLLGELQQMVTELVMSNQTLIRESAETKQELKQLKRRLDDFLSPAPAAAPCSAPPAAQPSQSLFTSLHAKARRATTTTAKRARQESPARPLSEHNWGEAGIGARYPAQAAAASAAAYNPANLAQATLQQGQPSLWTAAGEDDDWVMPSLT